MTNYDKQITEAEERLNKLDEIQKNNKPFNREECSFLWVDDIGDYAKAFGKNVNNELFYPRFRRALALNIRDELLIHEIIYWQYQVKKTLFLKRKQNFTDLFEIINEQKEKSINIRHLLYSEYEEELRQVLIANNYYEMSNGLWEFNNKSTIKAQQEVA